MLWNLKKDSTTIAQLEADNIDEAIQILDQFNLPGIGYTIEGLTTGGIYIYKTARNKVKDAAMKFREIGTLLREHMESAEKLKEGNLTKHIRLTKLYFTDNVEPIIYEPNNEEIMLYKQFVEPEKSEEAIKVLLTKYMYRRGEQELIPILYEVKVNRVIPIVRYKRIDNGALFDIKEGFEEEGYSDELVPGKPAILNLKEMAVLLCSIECAGQIQTLNGDRAELNMKMHNSLPIPYLDVFELVPWTTIYVDANKKKLGVKPTINACVPNVANHIDKISIKQLDDDAANIAAALRTLIRNNEYQKGELSNE